MKQWLDMRAFILATEEDNVFPLPSSGNLNEDKIVFNTYASAALYCGVDKGELKHLDGPTNVR